jgi:hypothetical protein
MQLAYVYQLEGLLDSSSLFPSVQPVSDGTTHDELG